MASAGGGSSTRAANGAAAISAAATAVGSADARFHSHQPQQDRAHMADASARVKECSRRLRRELNRLPTNDEIAVDTGMPIRRVEAAMSLPRYTVSLTGKVGCTDVTYQEIMPDTSAETAEEVLHRWLMKKDVDRALDSLSPREKQVLRYRFGIDGGRPRTLHDIGQLMGVSRERIRQIEMGAFRKLRSKKRVQSLQHYLQPAESW